MYLKSLLKLSIFIGCCAAFIQLDVFQETRNSIMVLVHQKLGASLKSCPYHVFQDLIASLGLSNSGASDSSLSSKSTPGPQSVIRYETDRLFTKDELSKYAGEEDSLGLYLGILGRVYDVSKGEQYYAPGKGYGFFSGRDGTRAFMSGDFTDKGLIDEVTGLSLPQMLELETWIDFYEKTYTYKGKVIGNFYDERGKPKHALYEAERLIGEAHKEKESKEEQKRRFPPCNSSWTKEAGGWVSCSDKSGGVKRDWVGVPRKYHTPGKPKPVCVCVRTTGPPYDDPTSTVDRGELDNPHLEEYEGCEPTAISCKSG